MIYVLPNTQKREFVLIHPKSPSSMVPPSELMPATMSWQTSPVHDRSVVLSTDRGSP